MFEATKDGMEEHVNQPPVEKRKKKEERLER
jgi:hypothetical protein